MSTDTGKPHLDREHLPLKPNRGVLIVKGGDLTSFPPSKITLNKIGQKALGIASIPAVWSPPFFVVDGETKPSKTALDQALIKAGLQNKQKLIVRSSGLDESIESRGSNDSKACSPDNLYKTIELLQKEQFSRNNLQRSKKKVHWIVQEEIYAVLKGHLSNERRVSKVDRDWLAEIEGSKGQSQESHSIAIRPWRDARIPSPKPLACLFKDNYVDGLELVARWAYLRILRIHFEWVWDGKVIYIVQADVSGIDGIGVDPKNTVTIPMAKEEVGFLEAFREPADIDFKLLPKLRNTLIYKSFGFDVGRFFLLDGPALSRLINDNILEDKVARDIDRLTQNPLIFRTDSSDSPENFRTMLLRSDELRSKESAIDWLVNVFASKIRHHEISKYSLALIGHNFIPAVSSAWCKADPKLRKVRIESLWGIPEGIYWYAHDVFDVDTLSVNIPNQRMIDEFRIHERLRYKSQFIAPDSEGNWVLHRTAKGPDWNPSIPKQRWVKEIAWWTRRIAEKEDQPVIVMWFVDVPPYISSNHILPWYHQVADTAASKVKAAPRKNNPSDIEFCISTRKDWDALNNLIIDGSRVTRVTVTPQESDLIRDRDFVKNLGALAKKHNIVVELSGGILSHAYYLLIAEGCAVECADLFAADNEELEFNKLVRDEIPTLITTHGEKVDVVSLKGEALVESLKRKVLEESYEVFESKNKEEVIAEIADLLEVIEALEHVLSIDATYVDNVKKDKRKKRGGFEKGLMLRKTAMESSLKKGSDTTNLEFNFSNPQSLQVICDVSELPRVIDRTNTDIRHRISGEREQQTTISIPIYEKSIGSVKLDQVGINNSNVLIDGTLERDGSNLKLRIRTTLAPKQMELELPDDD